MASFDTLRTSYGSATGTSRFFGFINKVVASAIAWNDARVTRNALASLTDRELQDIGLSRSDIARVAEGSVTR